MIYRSSYRVSKYRFDKVGYPKSVYLFAYDAGINQLFSLFVDWFFNNNQFVFAEMIVFQIFQTWLQSVTKCPSQLMENDGNRRR